MVSHVTGSVDVVVDVCVYRYLGPEAVLQEDPEETVARLRRRFQAIDNELRGKGLSMSLDSTFTDATDATDATDTTDGALSPLDDRVAKLLAAAGSGGSAGKRGKKSGAGSSTLSRTGGSNRFAQSSAELSLSLDSLRDSSLLMSLSLDSTGSAGTPLQSVDTSYHSR